MSLLVIGPLAYAEMLKIQKRLGKEGFPLIPMTYYPNLKSRFLLLLL